ncbi:unnamed protein product [Chrysoparadoxa australica]
MSNVIDSIEYSRAFFELFEGAIYLHQARTYLVTRLDLGDFKAFAKPAKVDYHTSPSNTTDVMVVKKLESSACQMIHTGCVDVVARVYGFHKIWLRSGIAFEHERCSLPPLEFSTRGFWIDFKPALRAEVAKAGLDFQSGVHALSHLILSVAPLYLLCDQADIDCEHEWEDATRPRPQRLMIYDKRPGGIGVAQALFTQRKAVIAKACSVLRTCPCSEGCLGCIYSHKCGSQNVKLDKQAGRILLEGVLDEWKGCKDERDEEELAKAMSPRKKARVDLARGMDAARAKDIRVRARWIKSNRDFQPTFG